MYICPVCGYERLSDPPKNFSICSCCGTEFGFDDFDKSYAKLRSIWIAKGYPWFDPIEHAPEDWDPTLQLENLQFSQNPGPIALEGATSVWSNPPLAHAMSC